MKNHKIKSKVLIKTLTKLDALYYQKAKEMGITTIGYMLLYALSDNEVHTQKEICNTWLFPRTTLNTVVKEFEKNKYIELVSIPKYKRDLQIVLTKQGKLFADKILSPLYKAEEKAMDNTVEKFNSDFVDALKFYYANLKIEFNNIREIGVK